METNYQFLAVQNCQNCKHFIHQNLNSMSLMHLCNKGHFPWCTQAGTSHVYTSNQRSKQTTRWHPSQILKGRKGIPSSKILKRRKREWDGLYVHDIITTESFKVFPEDAFYYAYDGQWSRTLQNNVSGHCWDASGPLGAMSSSMETFCLGPMNSSLWSPLLQESGILNKGIASSDWWGNRIVRGRSLW